MERRGKERRGKERKDIRKDEWEGGRTNGRTEGTEGRKEGVNLKEGKEGDF